MFVYILELLNGKGNLAFFDLKAGGRKANNAQKEKRRLARKRSCASKREREREAAKVAKLPARQRQCEACGCISKKAQEFKGLKRPYIPHNSFKLLKCNVRIVWNYNGPLFNLNVI